jgi:EAL domain-containing protein (putative c-di-GMP-specific phosphodiesterase class I)
MSTLGTRSRDILDALTALGCEYAQGFLLARPLSPDDAILAVGRASGAPAG